MNCDFATNSETFKFAQFMVIEKERQIRCFSKSRLINKPIFGEAIILEDKLSLPSKKKNLSQFCFKSVILSSQCSSYCIAYNKGRLGSK